MIRKVSKDVLFLNGAEKTYPMQSMMEASVVISKTGPGRYQILKNREGVSGWILSVDGLFKMFTGEIRAKVAKTLYEFGDIDQDRCFLECL